MSKYLSENARATIAGNGRKRRSRAVAVAVAAILGSAASAVSAQDSPVLEEVTVTAQFRRENLQETPVAITAVNAAMLEARNQTSLFEVAAQAPNVTLKPGGQAFGPSMIAFVRGVGQSDFNFALEPGVGIYVDDVYYSTLTGSLLDLLDLDRVEVLRGPQGTLAGRNSIGGAIKLYSKAPTGSNDGSVQATYGSYNRIEMRAVGDTTLIPDKLFARISGVGRERDGFVKLLDYGCTHPGSGAPVLRGADGCQRGTLGGQSYAAGRLALRWVASDDVDVNFGIDYLNDNSEANAATLLYGHLPTPLNAAIYPADDGNPATPPVTFQNHIFVPYGRFHNPNDPVSDPYVNYSTFCDSTPPSLGVSWKPICLASKNTLHMWGTSAKIDWRLSDTLSLVSITAYRKYDSVFSQDQDQSPVAVSMGDNRITHTQKSQEVRLNGSIGELSDWTLGAFYFDQDGEYEGRIDLNYTGLDFIHGPDPTPATTWALFAHAVWHLVDRFDVTTGLRYSSDEKDYVYHRHNPDGTTILGPPAPNFRLGGLDGTSGHFEDTRVDWRVVGDYKWTDDLMTYAQVSTGYKGGGVNPRPFFAVQETTFQPETMVAYEIGFKSTWFDQLRLNGAVFYNNYKDIQLTLTQCIQPSGAIGAPCRMPANVGDAKVKGAELEFEYRPVRAISFDGSISYLDFEYTRVGANALIQDPLAVALSPIAPMDMITPYTPKLKWSLGARYEFPETSAGVFALRADADHQSSVFTDATNSAYNELEGYTLINARLVWNSPEEVWEAALEGTNLTDKVYYLASYDQHQTNSAGQVTALPGLPRAFAVTLKRRFK